MTRRTFVTGAAACFPRKLPAAATPPLAVQLYSLRGLAKVDLSGVLAHVAELGYDGVEFAGYYGHSAAEIRAMLNSHGLRAAGSHVDLPLLSTEEYRKTADFSREIGNTTLIVPSVPEEYRNTIAGWSNAGKLLSEIAARLKPMGFVLGYHNHAREFQRIEGELPFDALLGASSQEVKIQLDVGHALQGGSDPAAILTNHRGRIVSVHIKDYSAADGIVEFGEGAVRWADVFRAAKSDSRILWYISEEEAKVCQAYSCIEHSIERIRRYL